MTRKLLFVIFVALILATPAFAQGTPGGTPWGNWSISGVGLGIAVGLAGLGQGRVAAAACEGMARNPGARAGVQLAMIFGLAFIESLVLFIWVMIFLRAT
jgi:F-type H+-transporting ATPase subunit c